MTGYTVSTGYDWRTHRGARDLRERRPDLIELHTRPIVSGIAGHSRAACGLPSPFKSNPWWSGGRYSWAATRAASTSAGSCLPEPVGQNFGSPMISMAAPPGKGYLLVAADRHMFNLGNVASYGSVGSQHLNAGVVGMAAPDRLGYWLVTGDGGQFSFANPRFYGSMGGDVNAPVGIAAPNGRGYWLIVGDGGVFSFPAGLGGTPFYGSLGGHRLNALIVIASPRDGGGYGRVAANGGAFAFSAGNPRAISAIPSIGTARPGATQSDRFVVNRVGDGALRQTGRGLATNRSRVVTEL